MAEDKKISESENTEDSVKKQTVITPTVTLGILKVIKESQQQHGLRHSDYQRYRGYCTRRIRRLRKVIHLSQGDKRHFKRRDVTEEKVTDERFLMVPLMLAERSWAYAMQLRQEANTEPRKRFHLIQRLRKSSVYAVQLQKLCEIDICDARTKLEAQAYSAWIQGTLQFELQSWKPAMESLNKAKMVYEKLQNALAEDEQLVYKQRVDELEPSLRYCAYNIGDQTAMDDLLSLRNQAHGDILQNLDALMAQTQGHQGATLIETTWRNRTFPLRPERVKLFLLADQELDTRLAAKSETADRIEELEKHLLDCKDAIAAAKDEVKADPASKARTSGPPTPLQNLVSYLTYVRLIRTIERTDLMVESAKAGLKVKVAESDRRKTRPQDLTRLYEIIHQNLMELQQLPGFEEDKEYQQEIEAKITAYKAFRCFYIAEVLANQRRWAEAGAMYQRAESYAQEALPRVAKMKSALTKLIEEVDGARYSSLAHTVLEGDSSDSTHIVVSKSRKKIPLIERLDEYREDPALATRQPNVIKLPPEMEPVPCKPLFFDLALNLVHYPSLDDKLETTAKKINPAGISGFVKGLWGWGGNK